MKIPRGQPNQFRIRHLLVFTTVLAAVFAAARVCAERFPDALIVIAIIAFPFAIAGLACLAFSVFMAFSLVVSQNVDAHRSDNIGSCARMFLAGVAAISTFAYCVVTIIFDRPA